MASDSLPTDGFSRVLRMTADHPGAVRASSTVNLQDFLGNSETWNVDTVRVDGSEIVFLQRVNAEGGMRLVLPAEITAAMARQRDRVLAVVRRRGARQAVATKLAHGQAVGNPGALRDARRARKAAR